MTPRQANSRLLRSQSNPNGVVVVALLLRLGGRILSNDADSLLASPHLPNQTANTVVYRLLTVTRTTQNFLQTGEEVALPRDPLLLEMGPPTIARKPTRMVQVVFPATRDLVRETQQAVQLTPINTCLHEELYVPALNLQVAEDLEVPEKMKDSARRVDGRPGAGVMCMTFRQIIETRGNNLNNNKLKGDHNMHL